MTASDRPNPGERKPYQPIDELQAQTHREMLEVMEQRHQEKLEVWINFTSNALALSIVFGFFGIVGVALLGFADITNATVAAFIGTTLGYVVGSIAPISQYFFKMAPVIPSPPEPQRMDNKNGHAESKEKSK